MKSFQDIQRLIAPELDSLNSVIREKLTTDNPLMNRVIDSYLLQKGKQIRPVIVLLTARLFGQVTPRTIAAAAAVELLHNASLIHDDVVDNSMMRRSAPTINAIWDNHIAVLVGDFFVSTSMQQALATGDMRVIDALCHLGRLLSLGELDQIYNARFHTLTEEAYFRIISLKTASLFVACAKMGYYSVDNPQGSIDSIMTFAELLGQCFQIRDDIFDYYADNKVGKPTGNDLKEGKITLPLLHTLLDDTIPGVDDMRKLSCQETLTPEGINTLISFAVDNGGIEYAYAKMAELRDRAASKLDGLGDPEARQALIDIFDSIIARDF